MSQRVDGKKIQRAILEKLKARVRRLKKKKIQPFLTVVLVGKDRISEIYVRKKKEAARKIGIKFQLFRFPASVSARRLMIKIKEIQRKSKPTGLIIQLPLPKRMNTRKILDAVGPVIDVDCLTSFNLGKLATCENYFIPPTPGAILEILDHFQIDLRGKNTVLVGQGRLVGKPLAILLFQRQATLTLCNRSTKSVSSLTKKADILITGVGKPNLIKASMIKKGAVVIDAGTSFFKGKIKGDVAPGVLKKAKLMTPVPGGVGPITVAKLLENTVLAAERLKK